MVWDWLAIEFPRQLHLYYTRTKGGRRIDLHSIMRCAPADALFYVSGPGQLIEAPRLAARELGIAAEFLQ